jgi:ECF transporter S component (folate family)
MKGKLFNTRTMVSMGLLLAMEIVLSRFLSVNAWNIKIGFNFVPVAVAAMLYGPLAAGLVAGLGDFLGAILFPIGPYFPGFTFTAFLTGAVLGLLLHKKRSPMRIGMAVAVNQLILGLFLNTFLISTLYGSPFWPLLVTRIVQCALLLVVQFVVIGFIGRALERRWKRVAA